ncbi:MAG: gliding motility-associated C-terminal domain-containing protein [Capnocytophaga sp.]|nr:gliding motility-associated C-terminal domain-containing protein [Capnocytophaga sp.]
MYNILKHTAVGLCLSWNFSYGQKVGETSTLSVLPNTNDTYVWELYDTAVDFASVGGNCPPSKATFVGANTGNQVQVKWLSAGEYFYKVTAQNDCSNNIKIGKITIKPATPSYSPPTIGIIYDCVQSKAILIAHHHNGALLWSTGETTPMIEVSTITTATYWVEETIGTEKHRSEITVTKAPSIPSVSETILKVREGTGIRLLAECESGHLKWFTDYQLTQELTDNYVIPWQNTDYYAVCLNDEGCRSVSVKVRVEVHNNTSENCKNNYDEIFVPNAISVNADGQNDVWEIPNLKEYCTECNDKNKVMIFNRWGVKVYEKENYMLDAERFNGKPNSGLIIQKEEGLPQGTYFYIIEFQNNKTKKGFIYLKNENN